MSTAFCENPKCHQLCDDCVEALTILFAAQLDVRADVECPDWVLCVALGMAE